MKFENSENLWYLEPSLWGNWLIRRSYANLFYERPIEAQAINKLFWEAMHHYNYYLRSLSLTYDRASEIIDLVNESQFLGIEMIEFISNRKQVSKSCVYEWIRALSPILNLEQSLELLEENESFENQGVLDYSIIDIHRTSVDKGTRIECAGAGVPRNWHDSNWELSYPQIDFVGHKGCLNYCYFPSTLCSNCFAYFHQSPIPSWLHYLMNEKHKEYKIL